MNDYERCKLSTQEHVEFVRSLLNKICDKLIERGQTHDSSKLLPPEIDYFVKYTPILASLQYGSKEYAETLENMKPALEHHYANSRHHSEHFPDGINGMNLVDIVEMLCDWYAAAKRNKSGNILKSISVNKERYGMSDDLTNILKNTADMLEL